MTCIHSHPHSTSHFQWNHCCRNRKIPPSTNPLCKHCSDHTSFVLIHCKWISLLSICWKATDTSKIVGKTKIVMEALETLHNGIMVARSQKRVVCAAICASWFKNVATGIDRPNRRAQATQSRSLRHELAYLDPKFFSIVQYIVQIIHMCLSFYQKKMERFSGRFWEIPGTVWKLNFQKI